MNPSDTLIAIGKIVGFMGMGFLIFITVLAQYTYWSKNEKIHLHKMTSKFKFLYHFGKYECWFFVVCGGMFLTVALVRALWYLVTTTW